MNPQSMFIDGNGQALFSPPVLPHIYAFESATLNRLNGVYAAKIGDTARAVGVRLAEWRAKGGFYSDIELLAKHPAYFIHDDKPVYYRDYNIHAYLAAHGYRPLIGGPVESGGTTVSREFFVNSDGKFFSADEVIRAAREDIEASYGDPGSAGKYSYYKEPHGAQTVTHYTPTDDFCMRGYQQETVEKASEYLLSHSDGDFLLSAPTRSGKSFMSAHVALSVCENSGREEDLVIVVSGKADVADEWKQTFEKHVAFNQKETGPAAENRCGQDRCTCPSEFVFLDKSDLISSENAVEDAYENGARSVAMFLTLQDLFGSVSGKIKDVHAFLNAYKPTLVISDEAHFASFTPDGRFRKVITIDSDDEIGDDVTFGRGLGALDPTHGRLFVTATPFNALMQNTTAFSEDNRVIITEADIIAEAKAWLVENPDLDEQDSPYYGLPNKMAFVVDLGQPSTTIFEVNSEGFVHEEKVEEIFSGMFGFDPASVCPEVFSDENYLAAGLGRGTIFTFDRRVACDAARDILERLFEIHGVTDVEIITVSSKNGTEHSAMKTPQLKNHVKQTTGRFIILTADRLLTGVSLEKVDTIVFCRGTASAQFAVQAMGRVGTPWVGKYTSDDGDVIKVVEKPNAAVISFDRDAMLLVRHAEARYNQVDTGDEAGVDFIQEFLDARPLFLYDAASTEMVQATAADVLAVVLDRTKDSGFRSWAREVPVDLSAATSSTDIMIGLAQVTAGKNDKSLSIAAFDIEDVEDSKDGICRAVGCDEPVKTGKNSTGHTFRLCEDHQEEALASKGTSSTSSGETDREDTVDTDDVLSRIQTVLVSAMLYAFLHPDEFTSAAQVATSAREPENADMARHIRMDYDLLDRMVSEKVIGAEFDYRLVLTERLREREHERPYDTFGAALASMGQFSDNELPTHEAVADLLVDEVDLDKIDGGIIDPAAKSAVMLVQAYHRAVEAGKSPEDLAGLLWSIPTSGTAYEVIRAVYEAYGWDAGHILFHDEVTCLEMNELLAAHLAGSGLDAALDRLALTDDARQEVRSMVASSDEKFDYVISNPPYQDSTNRNSRQIYDTFYLSAGEISHQVVMIFPLGWQKSSGRGTGSAKHPAMRADRRIVSVDNYYEDKDVDPRILFPGVGTGGVSIVSWRDDHDNGGKVDYREYGESVSQKDLTDTRYWSDRTDEIFTKLDTWRATKGIPDMKPKIPGRTPFGIRTYMTNPNRAEYAFVSEAKKPGHLRFWANGGKGKGYQWFYMDEKAPFLKKKNSEKWKLVWPITGAYASHRRKMVFKPGEVFSDTFICAFFDTEAEAENFGTYLSTLLYRFLNTESTPSHNANSSVHRHCPDLSGVVNPVTGITGWGSTWSDDDLKELLDGVLDDDDWEYIETTALNSDGGRR